MSTGRQRSNSCRSTDEKQGVEVFSMGDKNSPVNIAKAAMEHAAKNDFNIVIIDTAGRLHIDEDMMAELDSDKRKCRQCIRPSLWWMP